MKLHILGSGSCLVKQQSRAPASYVLETEKSSIMIDTGAGVTRNIPDSDFSLEDIEAIINTHRHPDHISDLVPLVQNKVVESVYYGENEDKDLQLYGPETHKEYIESRIGMEMYTSSEKISNEFPFDVEVKELHSEKQMSIAGLNLEVIETEHGDRGFPCLAVRLDGPENSIVFTGDTDYFEGLSEFSADADVIVADCSMPDDKKVAGHMTPSECSKVAKEAGVDILVLSHLYPEAEEANLRSQADFSGEVVVAEDLMSLEL